MTNEGSRRMQELLVRLGARRLDEKDVERVATAMAEVESLGDAELAALLAATRGAGTSGGTEQIRSIREAVRAVIDLRISSRQLKQAEALTAAVEQLKETDSSLRQTIEWLRTAVGLAGVADKIGGGGR